MLTITLFEEENIKLNSMVVNNKINHDNLLVLIVQSPCTNKYLNYGYI